MSFLMIHLLLIKEVKEEGSSFVFCGGFYYENVDLSDQFKDECSTFYHMCILQFGIHTGLVLVTIHSGLGHALVSV